MFERFSDNARRAMALANQEAMRFHHEYIGTEHILAGLAGSGTAANVLQGSGAGLPEIRAQVEKLLKSGAAADTLGKVPQTPRAKKVIENAILESRRLGHKYVGTGHMLLGILDDADTVAVQVLLNLGLHLDDVRARTLAALSHDTENLTAAPPWPQTNPDTHKIAEVIDGAFRVAKEMGGQFPENDHYLLALLQSSSPILTQALANLGLTPDQLRQEVLKLLYPPKDPPSIE